MWKRYVIMFCHLESEGFMEQKAVSADMLKKSAEIHKRDSNIELLRIITMLLIVAHHYVVNSGLTALDRPLYANPLSWRSIFLFLFGA